LSYIKQDGFPSNGSIERYASAHTKYKRILHRAKKHKVTLKENKVLKLLKLGYKKPKICEAAEVTISFVNKVKITIIPYKPAPHFPEVHPCLYH
jgi:hypothetical protein